MSAVLLAGAARARITSATELLSALNAAHGGETLLLAPGSYGPVMIANMRFERPVTITSEDPARRAIFDGLMVRGSAGLNFTELEFFAPPAAPGTKDPQNSNTFVVNGSHDITFDRIDAHGDPHGVLATDVSGFNFRQTQNVTLTRSEIHNLHNGVGQLQNEHLTITGNWFHDLRDDGVRGGDSSFVTITHNRFESMHPDASDPDHPDCIQFWTANTTQPQHDLTITDNFYRRGSGRSVQGIFFGNEKGVPYERVTIARNVLAGAGYQGIAVNKVDDLTLTDNFVARFPDQVSWILVIFSHHSLVRDNKAGQFIWSTTRGVPDTNDHLERSNNRVVDGPKDGGKALYASWLGRQDPSAIAASPK